jgi:hypothetical protein
MVTPQETLPSIIFFGVESPPLSKIIVLASFFSAYSTIPVTIDAGVTMTSDLKSIHCRSLFNISENTFEFRSHHQ